MPHKDVSFCAVSGSMIEQENVDATMVQFVSYPQLGQDVLFFFLLDRCSSFHVRVETRMSQSSCPGGAEPRLANSPG
jgi:hypothetical protein